MASTLLNSMRPNAACVVVLSICLNQSLPLSVCSILVLQDISKGRNYVVTFQLQMHLVGSWLWAAAFISKHVHSKPC